MQQRSGNMLPPPLDDPFNSSGVPTDIVIVRSAHKVRLAAFQNSVVQEIFSMP